MTVGELIAKLSKLPPSTIVVMDDGCCSSGYDDPNIYAFQGRVERGACTWVCDGNGRDDVETVILISRWGHDDKAGL